MIQWEYKIVGSVKYTVEQLNEFGNEGWELVTIIFTSRSAGGYDYFDYYFKRQITENK